MFSLAIIGRPNVGKSTLFNRLTGAMVIAADQLFATLDPTLRRIEMTSGRSAILTDTVGFIRDLPHELVESFQATLEEVREADLLLHVIDVEQEQRQARIDEVNQVIEMIDASHVPQIEIYNKIDKYPAHFAHTEYPENGPRARIWLSSTSGEGIDDLKSCIEHQIHQNIKPHFLTLPVTAGHLRAKLFNLGAVRNDGVNADGSWDMEVELEEFRLQKLCEEASLDITKLQTDTARY